MGHQRSKRSSHLCVRRRTPKICTNIVAKPATNHAREHNNLRSCWSKVHIRTQRKTDSCQLHGFVHSASLWRVNHPDGSHRRKTSEASSSVGQGADKETGGQRPICEVMVPERREKLPGKSRWPSNMNEAVDQAWHVTPLCQRLVTGQKCLMGPRASRKRTGGATDWTQREVTSRRWVVWSLRRMN